MLIRKTKYFINPFKQIVFFTHYQKIYKTKKMFSEHLFYISTYYKNRYTIFTINNQIIKLID